MDLAETWQQFVLVVSGVISVVAAIDILILVFGVLDGNPDAIGNWIARHLDSMIWLTVAEALGLTTFFGSLAGPLLKAWATD